MSTKKKTTEEFKIDMYNKLGDDYELLSDYTNNKTKVRIKHNVCNREYEVIPHSINRNKPSKCPYCYGNNIRKTTEEFRKEVNDKYNGEYELVSEYTNNKIKVRIKHNICNNEYEVNPNRFLCGDKCPFCSKHQTQFKNNYSIVVKDKLGDDYELLSDYVNNKTKIKILHKVCNKEYEVRPYNIDKKKPNKCPFCYAKNIKKNTKIFKEEVFNLVGNEYTVLGKYEYGKTKIKMRHNKCNREYMVSPDMFLNKGRRCPNCKRSKGEDRIRKYLEDNNIYFQEQFSFPDCKNIYPLKFDFMLEDDSGKIILIEYDGIFHYKNLYNENLEDQKKRDKIKDEYCNNHDNIDLHRISYKEFDNIETILDEIIESYN